MSGSALRNKPHDQADHSKNTDDSDPNAGLKNITDKLTAGERNNKKKQKWKTAPKLCHERSPVLVSCARYLILG